MMRSALALIGCCLITLARASADDGLDRAGPLAHWKLAGDAADATGRFDAQNRGIAFSPGGPDGASPAARFDGRASHLAVKPDPRLSPGLRDFTLALWVRTGDSPGDDSGDLVALYDETKRIGFNLSLRTSANATGLASAGQLQFGIDAAVTPQWTDEGRPGSAVLAFALSVHDGRLYAGTADNAPRAAGRVYQYTASGEWTDCGAPDRCNAVTSLIAYNGALYAATGKYRFAGSSLPESNNPHLGGGVFRYEGGSRWSAAGRLPGVEAVGGMAVFRGQLYASSLYKPAGFFRREPGGAWTPLPTPDGQRVVSLAAFNDALWATSYDDARVYRYDGAHWEDLGRLGDNTQTYSFTVHRGRLCVGTWPSGRVFRWIDGRWDDLGRLSDELEVMGMHVHNGQLYGGTLPLGAVFRYDGDQSWTKTAQLDTTPDVKYRRVWTMAQFDGRLFASTLPSGRIHALEAGPCVTYDRQFPAGWQHLAAVKRGGLLQLYVSGHEVAQSRPFDPAQFNLVSDAPLHIGAGSGDFFHGSLADVQLYHRALNDAELSALAQP
ncbi:MAG: LamG domain-containing protein [Pirellulales bacterium]|nr:LamG domain-containing protein [Pirellulales bacterium]